MTTHIRLLPYQSLLYESPDLFQFNVLLEKTMLGRKKKTRIGTNYIVSPEDSERPSWSVVGQVMGNKRLPYY